MFKSARIKLTAYYLLVMMVVTLSFSALVYTSTVTRTQRALEMQERRMRSRIYDMPTPPIPPNEPLLDEDTIREIKKDTLFTLAVINTFILVITGIPGYWLAGKTLKPIEEMVDKQKKFTADAAHELKTPLTAIKTNLEVNLRNKKLDLKKSKEILKSTIEDVDSLTLLTNSLIKQSKYQNYRNGKNENIELKKLIEEVVKKLNPKAEEKKLNTSILGKEVEIKGNRESISELITVLLDNSIKYNKEKGIVDIKINKRGDYVTVSIVDFGLGIDEKDLPYIFDRFYKADQSRSKTGNDGFGLGLSIAKEIVESHKGKISVKSEKEKGTEFTIKLPLSQ